MGLTEGVILALIVHYSTIYDIDPVIATSIAKVESNFNPKATSHRGAKGLFQVMPINVDQPEKLFELDYNIKHGIRLLADAKKRCSRKAELLWVNCYNLGVAGEKRIKYPHKFPYVIKVTKQIRSLNENNNG